MFESILSSSFGALSCIQCFDLSFSMFKAKQQLACIITGQNLTNTFNSLHSLHVENQYQPRTQNQHHAKEAGAEQPNTKGEGGASAPDNGSPLLRPEHNFSSLN